MSKLIFFGLLKTDMLMVINCLADIGSQIFPTLKTILTVCFACKIEVLFLKESYLLTFYPFSAIRFP